MMPCYFYWELQAQQCQLQPGPALNEELCLRLCAEAGLRSLGKPFPLAGAHAATSQLAWKQEQHISSKAVILVTHLLPGGGFCDAHSVGCSVSGWQKDVSRRREKFEVLCSPHTATTAHLSFKGSTGRCSVLKAA